MSRQDKATTDRHAKILRELVKRPENKVCADCKKNDPRWAAWNLGVFLCIRCSGFHRGMGTHISRVKSVDLDIWTPEQMESIQKWGNRRANLYWEAHLKAGHVPPDHKMESFIRSKYESRRWAMDGPPPSDPSVLDGAGGEEPAPPQPPSQPASPSPRTSSHSHAGSISARRPASPSVQAHTVTTRQPGSRQLLSAAVAGRAQAQAQAQPAPSLIPTDSQPQPAAAVAAPAQQAPPQDDFFSLDFHAPPAAQKPASPPPTKNVKQDIMSLFSSSTASASAPAAQTQLTNSSFGANDGFGSFSSGSAQTSPWDAFGNTGGGQTNQQQTTSMMGNGGVGMWGATSGWNAPAAQSAQNNIWASTAPAQPQMNNNIMNTNDVWGSSTTTQSNALGSSGAAPAPKKDDVFGDLWGDFK